VSKRAAGKPPDRSRKNIARLVRSTSVHVPAPAATPSPHTNAHTIAAPTAPSEIGINRPSNKPPVKIATGGAKISFTARRVRASSE
jgi:hypothetical protein